MRQGIGRARVPPPPEVAVITLEPRSVSITDQLPGRTTAFRVAEVRPAGLGHRAEAPVHRRRRGARPASSCSRSIRPRIAPALGSAQAALEARAEAQAVTAQLLEERYAPLIAANAVSQQENDEAIAGARAGAEADVAAARAQVETARINVVYTQVLSPINGRIGRALVTEGALVTPGQAQPLATRAAARSHLRRHHAVQHRSCCACSASSPRACC